MSTLNEQAKKIKNSLKDFEYSILNTIIKDKSFLSQSEQHAIRWALSMARLSKCADLHAKNQPILLEELLIRYREKLFAILSPSFDNNHNIIEKDLLKKRLKDVSKLAKNERSLLLKTLKQQLEPKAFDEAVRCRPLALTLSGGGGSAYVFVGALLAMEEHKITPSIISGSSMGAVIGAYRAKTKKFSVENLIDLVTKTKWNNIAKTFSGSSKFGIPATFRLDMRDIVGQEFKTHGEYLRLKNLNIPLRVCVAGLSSAQPLSESDLKKYAHLFEEKDQDPFQLKAKQSSVVSRIMEFAQKPLKAIYLGGDTLTKEFDVLDAVGFSSAIPGVFHYDISRNDERMIELTRSLLIKEGVIRLIDGGFVDNLPTIEAIHAIEQGAVGSFDPLVVGLDCFSPNLNRHWLFYPIMRFAMENSRAGHTLAHISVKFNKVLSPLQFIPTKDNFNYAIENGYQEMMPHIELIKMALGPIPNPPWLVA